MLVYEINTVLDDWAKNYATELRTNVAQGITSLASGGSAASSPAV